MKKITDLRSKKKDMNHGPGCGPSSGSSAHMRVVLHSEQPRKRGLKEAPRSVSSVS